MRHNSRARLLRLGLRLGSLLLISLSLFVGARWWTGNQGVVEIGSIYRTAQLSSERIGRVVRERDIRTVLNLRGCNPDEAWYRAEREEVLEAGATLVDVAMASDQWMSRVQLGAVIELLERAPRPILIHCEWGAERTGLVSAFAELLRDGGSLDRAKAQFTAYFLFLPTADGRVMISHIEQYAGWLAARGASHSPERFREWASHEYRPLTPSREDWPYDPYPLVVVNRPDTPLMATQARSTGARSVK